LLQRKTNPAMEATHAVPKQKGRKQRVPAYIPYLFMVPFFAIFAVFMLYPILYSLLLSFSEWKSTGMRFIGLANYAHLFTDKLFWKSLLNTGEILLIQVPLMLLLATVLAVFINSDRLKYRSLFRIGFFLPVLIDLVTYSLVFSIIFNENYGMINQLLQKVGIGAIHWQTDGFWAKVMIILAITWRWTGYNSVIILSGLQMIPKELYEAASIDGASRFRAFWRITVPMLKPVLLFCTILSTIGTLQLFVEPYVLTRGGPNNETITSIFYLYQTAFGTFNFGLASAGAYVITTLIAILSFFQIRMSKGGEV
jgi:lactose/L-arabinose transport system permease protein